MPRCDSCSHTFDANIEGRCLCRECMSDESCDKRLLQPQRRQGGT
jgi:hypothetical protein